MSANESAAFRELMEKDIDALSDGEMRALLVRAGLVKPSEHLGAGDLDSWRCTLGEIQEENEREFPYDDAFLAGAAIGFCGGINEKMVFTAAAVKAYKDANPDADEDELIGFGIGLNV
ncbi:MAG TPA: hypothetical protein O0X70_01500 [Methanocorpusculum sp.]|nr:hypothetical protein [Methanocorpusculum sp.]